MTGHRGSGRKRKPSIVRKLEGRRSHARPLTEDVRGLGAPTCPVHFSPEQRRLWASVTASMPAGVYTKADSGLLESYCLAWGLVREASRLIEATGLMVRSERGPVKNPLVSMRRAAQAELRGIAAELGLSPTSRAKLPQQAAVEDPMSLLLGDDLDPTGAWTTPGPNQKAN